MPEVDQLKQKLSQELEKPTPDPSVLLALSSKIAEQDQSKVRFTVDAAHVNRLGLELVSKRETALSELIKNAYDADATSVHAVFDSDKNLLSITDNGVGMTRAELINGFMRLSTSMKALNTHSRIFGRYRAGRKGIGRFAAQRLGQRLTVVTKTESSDRAYKIFIDWNDFTQGADLITIASEITELAGEDNPISHSGTKLIIHDLRETWSKAQIKRVYRYASDILLPFPIANNDFRPVTKDENDVSDPGFSATFGQISEGNYEVVADAENIYLQHRLALIEGEIDSKGNAYWRLTSDKYSYDSGNRKYVTKTFQDYKLRNSDNARKLDGFSIRNVSFKAYYFQIRESHFPKNLTSIISENLRNFGGMRLYRNGFRVLPYGERYDDWLRFDFITRNRVILPPMSNNNFFGFVKITPKSIGDFEEVASREGLLENQSYEELREFVADSIVSAMVEFAYIRNVKAFANQQDYATKQKPNHENRADLIKDKFNSLIDKSKTSNQTQEDSNEEDHCYDSSASDSYSKDESETVEIPKDEFEELKANTLQYIDETNIYRVLGALGLAMAEFTHEIKYSVTTLNRFVRIGEGEGGSVLQEAASRLLNYVNLFESGFQSLANNQIETLDLRTLVNAFINTVHTDNEFTQGIEVKLELDGAEFFIKNAHEATILATLMNLYSNSKKAIIRAGGLGSISIQLKENENDIELYFSDQGDGISQEDSDKIFNLFYTRSQALATNVNAENDEMLGMGLGLPIIRELLNGVDGTIDLVEPKVGYSTTFLVTFPKETDEELINGMY